MDGYNTDDILSQALDLYEDDKDCADLFITQNRFTNSCITEKENTALEKAIDVTEFADEISPYQISARNFTTASSDEPTRFDDVSNTLLELKDKPFVPNNTLRKNKWAINLFYKWRREYLQVSSLKSLDVKDQTVVNVLMKSDDIISYSNEHLNTVLCYFFLALKKEDGNNYKGDSIFCILSAIQRHLNVNGRMINFLADPQFQRLKNTVDNKMQSSCKQGLGLHKKKADFITPEQESYLWENNFLGDSSPSVLLDTIFWTIGINFGLRGGEEHRNLSFKNFSIETDDDNVAYVEYTESISKTYRGGIKHRKIDPHSSRAYANTLCPEKCPVNLFNLYTSKLPTNRNPDAFYFRPLSVPKNNIWFANMPVGHNKLDGIVKRIMSGAGYTGQYTNHSLRATTATRLYRAGCPEQIIKEQTGHRSNAIENYKRTSNAQKRDVSSVLQGTEKSEHVEKRQKSTYTSSVSDACTINCNIANVTIYKS